MNGLKEYLALFDKMEPSYLVIKIVGERIYEKARQYLSGRLLEIGCGEKRNAVLVGEYVRDFIGIDLPTSFHDTSNVDIFASACILPFADNSFDSILCTSVLEHIEEPFKALSEAYRVLKSGGYGLFTVPLFWHIHEAPRDFYRLTKYGFHFLAQKAGFLIIETIPLSGFWVTFLSELDYYVHRFRQKPILHPFRWCVLPVHMFLMFAGNVLRRFDHSEEFTWMYLYIVQKP